MTYAVNLGCLVVAYLLGSIPTGFLVGKARGIDIREHGSGSTGATNVWRTIGKKEGVFVWLVDSLKGYGAVWLPLYLGLGSEWVVGSALLVLLGHSRSVWLGFQGGKSVASGLGVLLALNPVVAISAFGVWLLSLSIWRTVSISSIVAAFATPILFYLLDKDTVYLLFTIAGGIFVIVRHSSNIQRILAGTEPQIFGEPSGEQL
jgi:glycerol-3-phosphate acyltransferase PlsY